MPPTQPPSSSPPSTDNYTTTTKLSKRAKTSKPGLRGPKRGATPRGGRSPELGDGRHKRVWKACERCRMKKTKCDGELPCKRCKDDGLVCMAGSRKKAEFKQLQQGYAEVLENTQYALIATVHKLYAMVLASEPWTLPWPALNAHGQPVIHDIASKLGCIRADPTSSSTVPIKFPADDAEFAALQCKLESEERHDSRSGFEMVGLAGPESQFGNELFFGEFGEGFDGKFADVGKGYGVVVSTLQTRLSRQLQLASQQQEQEQQQQQQQQQQHPLRIQRAALQQMQQQGLDLWEAAWASASETEEQMRALMRAEGLYNAGLGVGSTAGDGTVRPNLLEYGFCRGLHRGG